MTPHSERKSAEPIVASDSVSTSARQRLVFIIYLRALAIILIVAGHCYGLVDIQFLNISDNAISTTIKGATALFVLVSGVMFDFVYGATYTYFAFILDRIKRLLIPYIILTTLGGLLFSRWSSDTGAASALLKDFLLGDTFQAYWYIPFIVAMFSLAPLHRLFTTMKPEQQFVIVILGTIFASVVQRPIENDNVVQSILFYSPIYLFGIFLSRSRTLVIPILKRHFPALLLATILVVSMQALNRPAGQHAEVIVFVQRI